LRHDSASHRLERVIDRRPGDERDGAAIRLAQVSGRILHLRRHVGDDQRAGEVRPRGGEPDRGNAAERHADNSRRVRAAASMTAAIASALRHGP
jgi:hypothetical protein